MEKHLACDNHNVLNSRAGLYYAEACRPYLNHKGSEVLRWCTRTSTEILSGEPNRSCMSRRS